jgi:hypothetical protein
MERGLGVLRVACGFGDVTAVEAYPPAHDQVVKCPARKDLLQDSCPSLLIARCHFRVLAQLGEVLFDLPSCCPADGLQVLLPAVIPPSELVVLQRHTAALVFDLAHPPHGSPDDAAPGPKTGLVPGRSRRVPGTLVAERAASTFVRA